MCTAIFDNKYGLFFGRTLDLECSFGERVEMVRRGDALCFIYEGERVCNYAIIGMALAAKEQLLFYDAVNEKGLCAAALNFPKFAVYHEKREGAVNIASFEVIPYLLSQCSNVGEVVDALKNAVITSDDFSQSLKSTSLHWMIADKERAVVLESVADGLKIYDNPIGVMTNSPPFPYHTIRLCDYTSLSPEHPENRVLPSQSLTLYSRGLGASGLPGDFSSSSRFIRAAYAQEHTLTPPCADETSRRHAGQRRIFDLLGTVSLPYGITRTESGEPIYTVYTSCIDMERCEYSYFTYNDRGVRVFKF